MVASATSTSSFFTTATPTSFTGDSDNRLKTLFDGLRDPRDENEILQLAANGEAIRKILRKLPHGELAERLKAAVC